jgi:DNA mismatch repair protein MutL
MRHPYFHQAVMEAYEHLIPAGEQVSYFIYFEVEPSTIDVNIHPTKTEIKFENEQAIWQITAAAVKEALGKFNAVPSIDFNTEDMPEIPAFDVPAENEIAVSTPPKVNYNDNYNPFRTSSASPSISNWEKLYPGVSHESKMNRPADSYVEPYVESDAEPSFVPETEEPSFDPFQQTIYPTEPAVVSDNGAQYLQYKGRYILTSVKSGLMIIDQHRAHIRVLYDRYMQQIKFHQGMSQGVLFPEIMQLPPSEVVVLQSITEDLTAIGFDISNLGGGSFAINGVPSGIEGLNPVELVVSMVHNAMEKAVDVKEEVQSILSLTLAKASAIVYGQVLSDAEMVNLVDSLFACPSPNYTPDGKVILSTLKEDEIDKRFR